MAIQALQQSIKLILIDTLTILYILVDRFIVNLPDLCQFRINLSQSHTDRRKLILIDVRLI